MIVIVSFDFAGLANLSLLLTMNQLFCTGPVPSLGVLAVPLDVSCERRASLGPTTPARGVHGALAAFPTTYLVGGTPTPCGATPVCPVDQHRPGAGGMVSRGAYAGKHGSATTRAVIHVLWATSFHMISLPVSHPL
jgi:hypothetical protein